MGLAASATRRSEQIECGIIWDKSSEHRFHAKEVFSPLFYFFIFRATKMPFAVSNMQVEALQLRNRGKNVILWRKKMDTLVKRAKNGDADAFISLIEECKMTLRRVALGYLRNDEDAADAIQDTILSAYEHIGRLKKEEHFKTWLVRILINHCTKIWRTNKKKTSMENGFCETFRADDTGKADVEFRALIFSLPEESRMIFQLYFGEQFTVREIADVLGMKENTVKSRLHRGKEKLRMELGQE